MIGNSLDMDQSVFQPALSPRAKMATSRSNRQRSLDPYVDHREYGAKRHMWPSASSNAFSFRLLGSNRQVASSRFDNGRSRGQTRCFNCLGALVACHPNLPSLAQLQANGERTLFGP